MVRRQPCPNIHPIAKFKLYLRFGVYNRAMKLLIIEDERKMAFTLKDELKRDYAIDLAFTGEEALYQIDVNEYDLILMDYILPDLQAPQLIKVMRNKGISCPILILTGQDSVSTTVECLDQGADDYLGKPFHFAELRGRLRALLRRSSSSIPEVIEFGDLRIDLLAKAVFRGSIQIKLRKKEFEILEFFARNEGKILTRYMIFNHIWDSTCNSVPNTVYVHINNLREQLDRPFSKKLIKTLHNVGYKFEGR